MARLLNQPEAAITLPGVLLNLVFTLLIWAVARKQEVYQGLAFCAAMATGLLISALFIAAALVRSQNFKK